MFKKYCAYWQGLSTEHKERTRVHLYRKWPVIDRMLTGHRLATIARYEKSDEPGVSIDCPFTSDHPDQDLLHIFGSGEYKFILNELGVPNGLMTVELVIVDDAYPPQLDYKELCHSHPLNTSYIDGLRRKQIPLPWDDEKTEEEKDEMGGANATVIGAMAGAMTNMAERISKGADTKEPSIDHKAMASGMAIIQEASNMGMRIVTEGIAANREKTDPIEMLRAVTELTGARKGDDAVTVALVEQVNTLHSQMQEQQNASNKEMRDMMRDMFKAQQVTAANVPPPKTELEILREAVEKKKLIAELTGETTEVARRRKSSDDDDDETKKPTTMESLINNAPVIMQGLGMVFSMGANIFHNYVALRTGGAAPPQQTPGSPQQAQAQQQPQGQPLPPGNLQRPPELQTQDPEMIELLRAQQMLTQMQDTLLAHYYGEGTGGDTFALWIITNGTGANPTREGRQVYDGMKEAGKDKLLMLLRSHAIWQHIAQTPQKTATFIDTFLAYDELQEEKANEEETVEKPIPPA